MAEFGDYPQLFETLLSQVQPRAKFRTYRVLDGHLPGRPDECDAWLITGSRHSVLDRFPWMLELGELIRQAMAQGVPIVGVCFGHQIMADALGGKVGRSDHGWSVGRQTYELAKSQGGRTSIAFNAFHEDQVLSNPDASTVIASSPTCPYAILNYGTSAMSVQGHPEFGNAFIEALILHRLSGKVSDAFMSATLKRLNAEPESGYVAQMLVDKLGLPA